MCGIIASLTKQPTRLNVEKVKHQFNEQRSRGVQGFGFVAVENGNVVFGKSTTEKEIMEMLDVLGPTTCVVFHHRVPTCNFNSVKTNHPIFIASKANLENKYFIVHNGHIQNTETLRTEHEKEGFVYRTNIQYRYEGNDQIWEEHTDSESLGIEMAKFIEGKTSRIKARGGAAIFMLQIDKENNPKALYSFRETNPIKLYRNQNCIFMASTSAGVEIPERKLFRIDLKTWKLESADARLSTHLDVGKEDDGSTVAFTEVITKPSMRISPEVEQMVEDIRRNTHVHKPEAPLMLVDNYEEHVNGNTLIVRSRKSFHGTLPAELHLKSRSELVKDLTYAREKRDQADGDSWNLMDSGVDVDSSNEYRELENRFHHWEKRVKEIEEKLELAPNEYATQ